MNEGNMEEEEARTKIRTKWSDFSVILSSQRKRYEIVVSKQHFRSNNDRVNTLIFVQCQFSLKLLPNYVLQTVTSPIIKFITYSDT